MMTEKPETATNTEPETEETGEPEGTEAGNAKNGDTQTDETGENTVVIRVLNGGGVAGAANRVSELLNDNGWPVSSIGNADSFDYGATVIRYGPGYLEPAEKIGRLFENGAELEETEEQEENIAVIVGKEF